MKKLKEVCRLKFGLSYSNRLIAQSLGISSSTVSEYATLFTLAGLNWSTAKDLSPTELESHVYRHPQNPSVERAPIDFDWVHRELKKKAVTLKLLWDEYKKQHPDGYGYTRFCQLYKRFAKTLSPTMRFNHKAGEACYVDYAGLTMEWIHPSTGEIHQAQIFVGALGASHLIYCEATETQSVADFIRSHVRMFQYFGGVPEKLICDNLKSGVTKAHRYDPDVNINYTRLAEHYDIAVLPARVRSPKDKPKVEVAVQCVEREIIAVLRHQTFSSIAEINTAIAELLEKLNHRPMQQTKLSRYQQFLEDEKVALKPLPKFTYEYQEHKSATVYIDYHVQVDKHHYSVPYTYVGKIVDVYLKEHVIEIYVENTRIAYHVRSYLRRFKFTTLAEHMPPNHRAFREELNDSCVERLLLWAKGVGDIAHACVKQFFYARQFQQQAIRGVIGLKRLHQEYGKSAFIAACQKALDANKFRYQFIEETLKHGLTLSRATSRLPSASHCRGKAYFT